MKALYKIITDENDNTLKTQFMGVFDDDKNKLKTILEYAYKSLIVQIEKNNKGKSIVIIRDNNNIEQIVVENNKYKLKYIDIYLNTYYEDYRIT